MKRGEIYKTSHRMTTMMDAGNAGRRVGYGSASQFSREYSRFFGSVNRLLEEGLGTVDGR